MWEWNLDWSATYVDPCTECADLTAATERVHRGGNFHLTSLSFLLPTYRSYSAAPTYRDPNNGLRCARAP
jgi:hypothetical protein